MKLLYKPNVLVKGGLLNDYHTPQLDSISSTAHMTKRDLMNYSKGTDLTKTSFL